MTLQLEVGKTYRARNGRVVKIVGINSYNPDGEFPFIASDGSRYGPYGRWSLCDNTGDDMLESEVIDQPKIDPFDAIVAKYEAAWEAEKLAMANVRKTMDEARAAIAAIVQAAKEGKL